MKELRDTRQKTRNHPKGKGSPKTYQINNPQI